MENSRQGSDPVRNWNVWLEAEGQAEGSIATIPEDEEEELHGNPDNRGVIDKIWDALRGGEDMEEADQNLGKSV